MLYISETYINQTEGYIFGEAEPYETSFDDDEIGKLFRSLQKEYGRCVSKVYIDTPDGGVKPIGWVFEKRMRYEDARPPLDERDYYIREVWVAVHETPPTKTIEYHYYDLEGAA